MTTMTGEIILVGSLFSIEAVHYAFKHSVILIKVNHHQDMVKHMPADSLADLNDACNT